MKYFGCMEFVAYMNGGEDVVSCYGPNLEFIRR